MIQRKKKWRGNILQCLLHIYYAINKSSNWFSVTMSFTGSQVVYCSGVRVWVEWGVMGC